MSDNETSNGLIKVGVLAALGYGVYRLASSNRVRHNPRRAPVEIDRKFRQLTTSDAEIRRKYESGVMQLKERGVNGFGIITAQLYRTYGKRRVKKALAPLRKKAVRETKKTRATGKTSRERKPFQVESSKGFKRFATKLAAINYGRKLGERGISWRAVGPSGPIAMGGGDKPRARAKTTWKLVITSEGRVRPSPQRGGKFSFDTDLSPLTSELKASAAQYFGKGSIYVIPYKRQGLVYVGERKRSQQIKGPGKKALESIARLYGLKPKPSISGLHFYL